MPGQQLDPACATIDLIFRVESRKDRLLLMKRGPTGGTQAADQRLDMEAVGEWVRDNKLRHVEQHNGPKGMERLRAAYAERENGNYPATPNQEKSAGKIHVARIKPYIASRYIDNWTRAPQHFPADKARIFAKAISNAMPYEKLDIMISRQSL